VSSNAVEISDLAWFSHYQYVISTLFCGDADPIRKKAKLNFMQ